MSIKIDVSVELKPIMVPNFILTTTDDELTFAPKDLTWETLDKLCNEFRKSLFAKSGLKDYKSS